MPELQIQSLIVMALYIAVSSPCVTVRAPVLQSQYLQPLLALGGLKRMRYVWILMLGTLFLMLLSAIASVIWSSVVVMEHLFRWISGNQFPLQVAILLDWVG